MPTPCFAACGFAWPALHYAGMIGLTDTQLKIVMNAARLVPVEKRDTFLQRAMLALRGRGRFTDTDVAEVAQLALTGLAHQPAGR